MSQSTYPERRPAADAPLILTGNPARDLANSFNVRVIAFLLLHLPLAMAVEFSPWLSTAHATVVLLYGLRAALLGRSRKVIYAVTYIAAAEVLWRMSRAYTPWEYSKYAVILIVLVALVVEWRKPGVARRIRTAGPVLLLMALLPGIALVIMKVGPAEARDTLSFNLSGHLAIVMLGLHLWARPIRRDATIWTLLALIAPVAGITFLAVYYTATSLDSLVFLGASNWTTSGSYGPNQVSDMMGLGALSCLILFVLIPRAHGARVFSLLLALVMLAQGVLTFSRGGMYSFLLATAAFGLHIMTTPRARRRFLALVAVCTIGLSIGIYPFLDDFTGGALSQRFSDLDSTGRMEAALGDWQAFVDNPLAGVGVGQSEDYHQQTMGIPLATHTEFTRLLAEHGLFGVLSIAVMIWMLLKSYLMNQPGPGRAMTAAFAVWSMSIMVHSAMRLAAISLAFSLALVLWQLGLPDEADAEGRDTHVSETAGTAGDPGPVT